MEPDRITESAADRALRVVRESGGRITSPTRAVIAVLANGDDHRTADDIIAELEVQLPGVAPSTIYRVIQRLSDLDLIEHVHTSVGPPIYHLRERGHAHLVCNGCGSIIDIGDEHLSSLRQVLSEEYGFSLSLHHSALVGFCSDCDTGPTKHTH